MLINMVDGGMVDYKDGCECYAGCPTCDYGSEYINEIDITLTQHTVHIKLNQMYEFTLSEGQMMKLFLGSYNTIQAMTEKEFISWLKSELERIIDEDELGSLADRRIEEFVIKER